MKKIIILIVSFLLVVGVCFEFFFFNYSKSEKIQDNKKIEYNNVDEKNEIIVEDSDKDNIIEEETNDNLIEDNTDKNKENDSANNKKEENKPITQTPQTNSNNSNTSFELLLINKLIFLLVEIVFPLSSFLELEAINIFVRC